MHKQPHPPPLVDTYKWQEDLKTGLLKSNNPPKTCTHSHHPLSPPPTHTPSPHTTDKQMWKTGEIFTCTQVPLSLNSASRVSLHSKDTSLTLGTQAWLSMMLKLKKTSLHLQCLGADAGACRHSHTISSRLSHSLRLPPQLKELVCSWILTSLQLCRVA